MNPVALPAVSKLQNYIIKDPPETPTAFSFTRLWVMIILKMIITFDTNFLFKDEMWMRVSTAVCSARTTITRYPWILPPGMLKEYI